MLQLEPPLYELEDEYRRRYLRSDSIQASAAIVVWNILSIFSLRADYAFFGAGPQFYGLLAARALLLVLGVSAVLGLNRTNDPRLYDRLTLAVMAAVAVFTLYVNFTRPADYFGHIPLAVALIFGLYLAIPVTLPIRTGTALLFTVGSAVVVFTRPIPPMSGSAIGLSVVAANVVGFYVSARLNGVRRDQFKALANVKQTHEDLRRVTATDALTGITNRRALIQEGLDEFARSRRYSRPFAIIIMDLDNFKQINDKYGHAAGDEVLRQFAQRVMNRKRRQDTFGRLGGTEFAMLLPETRLADAQIVGERLRLLCSETPFEVEGGQASLTLSIGLVERADGDTSFDTLQKRADEMLYRAKQGGQNRLVAG